MARPCSSIHAKGAYAPRPSCQIGMSFDSATGKSIWLARALAMLYLTRRKWLLFSASIRLVSGDLRMKISTLALLSSLFNRAFSRRNFSTWSQDDLSPLRRLIALAATSFGFAFAFASCFRRFACALFTTFFDMSDYSNACTGCYNYFADALARHPK